jgi:kumamolisin
VTPPAQRQRLSPAEFAAAYGASPEDIANVTAFAVAQGLTIVETHAARRTVVVSGTVAQMNKAFAVKLQRYRHEIVLRREEKPRTETYRGRDGFIHVPSALADVIVGVFGLDNRTITKRNGGDPPGTGTVTVPQIRQLYNFPANSAAGQTIGIMCGLTNFGDGYSLSDIQQYFTGLPSGFPTPTITDIAVHGSNSGSDPFGEITQDIDICGSAAPGAAIGVYFTTGTEQGWLDCIGRVAHPNAGDPLCSVLSSSYFVADGDDSVGSGVGLPGVSLAWITAITMTFQDAAIQGLTVCIASGDTGSDSRIGDGNAHVQYPVSDPWVLGVGGTTVGNISGSSFDEYVWNDTFFGGSSGATGGGISDFFAQPAYQAGAGVPPSLNDGHTGRGVPDVSANASPNSGYPIILGGGSSVANGTSASAPLWAGLIAVINAALGENVGFVNPVLYALGSSVFRDIVGAPGPADNGLNGVAGYPAGPGWDACTGWGSPNGTALLAGLQQMFNKDCVFITDRSTFSKDEIDAMLHIASPAVITAAFYVEVDGFRPSDLGITNADLSGVPSVYPTVTAMPAVMGMTVGDPTGKPTALLAQDSSLPPSPQRFTWVYPITFSDSSGFIPGGETVTLTAAIGGVSGSAPIQLVETANPYEVDGAVSWLSTDTRVFLAKQGESWFNAPSLGSTPADALSFITSVIHNLNSGMTGGQTFDSLPTDENTSSLALYQLDHNMVPVFNFALARVRYRALLTSAPDVRVFFRLCPALSVSTDYDQTTTYRRWPSNNNGQPISLLGLDASNNILTIPFFAEQRVDTTMASMHGQTDETNRQTIPNDSSGAEVEAYFGCWLDINQPGGLFPLNPMNDGPFGGTLKSVLDLVRNQHQCLLTEIAFDPEPITGNPSPAVSDKLAQRNLSLVPSDNPGDAGSRRIPNTFELKPTSLKLAAGDKPDELLIEWGNTPAGSVAEIYIPSVASSEILDLAGRMYSTHRLTAADPHTVRCQANGITYVPIPPGTDLRHAALLTVDLPAGVRRGQLFRIVVRQVTSASSGKTRQPGRPPIIQISGVEEPVFVEVGPPERRMRWRRVLGSVQISIPVGTAELLLPPEERQLSILRYIEESIPPKDRWYLVFRRYVSQIAERVAGFGGKPVEILPSPIGQWQHPKEGTHEKECEPRFGITGKITALIYDRFGDFEGFVLDTEEGERPFESTEHAVEEVARRAWSERILTTVFIDRDEPHRSRQPASIVLRHVSRPF